MDKRFVKRPLALFSAGFALAVIIFYYLPGYFLFSGALALLTGLVSALVRRGLSRQIMTAAFATVLGFVWCFVFSAFFAETYSSLNLASFEGKGIFRIPHVIAQTVGDSIDRVFPDRVSPFIRAITIGDASKLQSEASVYTALKLSGIAHIVAVSGMHVSFLISMVSPLLRSRRRRAFILIPLLLLFMGVSGFSPSVSRAVIMHGFVLLAPLLRRRSDSVTCVMAALLLLLIVNPASIQSTGLQLSFLSTLGLVLLNPKIERTFTEYADSRPALQKPIIRPVCRFMVASFSRSLSALAFSLPLTAYYFGYVAIFAPVTNLLTLWAASFAFCGGLIASLLGLIFTPLGAAAAAIASIPANWIIFVAKLISRIPFAAVYVSNTYILGWLLYLYASIVLLIALRGRFKAVMWTAGGAAVTLVLALLLTSMAPTGGLEITVLDVGQGQSIVVTDGAASAVIDCGGTSVPGASVVTASYLQERTVPPADLLILTHFHYDHAGNIPDLLVRERFNKLIIPDPALGGTTELEEEIITLALELGIDIMIVTETLEISFGSSVMTIFPPFGNLDENEACLTVLISDGGWDALITGDMPSETELLLLEYANLPDTELFIAGHHGSRYSNSYDFLEEITPEIVIISVGAENSYGHPSEETLRRFGEIGAEIYRTDISGAITVKSGD